MTTGSENKLSHLLRYDTINKFKIRDIEVLSFVLTPCRWCKLVNSYVKIGQEPRMKQVSLVPHLVIGLPLFQLPPVSEKKKNLSILYKQFICSTLNSGSPTWSPIHLKANIAKVKTTLNRALRNIISCLAIRNIQHPHNEMQMVSIQSYFKTINIQSHTTALIPPPTQATSYSTINLR